MKSKKAFAKKVFAKKAFAKKKKTSHGGGTRRKLDKNVERNSQTVFDLFWTLEFFNFF